MSDNHAQLWEKCLEIFKDNLPVEQFDAWFKPVTSAGFTNNELTLLVPSPYFVEQFEGRYIKPVSYTHLDVYKRQG